MQPRARTTARRTEPGGGRAGAAGASGHDDTAVCQRLYRYHGAFVRCACGLCGVPSPLRLRPTTKVMIILHCFVIRRFHFKDYQSCHMPLKTLNARWKTCTCTPHETDEKAFFPAATLLPAAGAFEHLRGRGRGSPTRDFPSTHGRQDDRSSCCPAPTPPRAFDLRNHHPSRCRICSRGTVGAGPCKGLSWLRCSCRLPRQASTNPS